MSYGMQDILDEASRTLGSKWTIRSGLKVPDTSDLRLNTDAVQIEGAVLYADLKRSSDLVRRTEAEQVARYYKVFLSSACDVLRNNDGTITSFDGDRVMAVFIGNRKCSNSAKAALQLHAMVLKLNELIGQKTLSSFRIDYAAGVDVSDLFVIRTGIRGSNYLAWIGEAANNAAKLAEIRDQEGPSFITERLFGRLNDESKYKVASSKDGLMWRATNVCVQGQKVYESSFRWNFK